jgi:outer membrane protein assembly factor BamB
MTHSSIVPVEQGGRRVYVYPASGGVAGVAGDDGRVVWETSEWRVTMANVPSPVPLGDGRILLSGGYGAGCMMIRLTDAGVEKVFRLKPEAFGAEQQTPIFYKGHIYGVIPGGQLVCMTPDGARVWASGSKERFGLGAYVVADGKLVLFNDTGTLTVAEASPAGFKVLARHRVFEDGHDCWGPIAVVGGRVIARDLTRMVCLDLTEANDGR